MFESFRYDAHAAELLMKPPGRNLKPFHVHIATLFIMLFTLLGGSLLAIQFQQGMQQGLEHARQSFVQYREQLSLTLQLNEQPARMSLSFAKSIPIVVAFMVVASLISGNVHSPLWHFR